MTLAADDHHQCLDLSWIIKEKAKNYISFGQSNVFKVSAQNNSLARVSYVLVEPKQNINKQRSDYWTFLDFVPSFVTNEQIAMWYK